MYNFYNARVISLYLIDCTIYWIRYQSDFLSEFCDFEYYGEKNFFYLNDTRAIYVHFKSFLRFALE